MLKCRYRLGRSLNLFFHAGKQSPPLLTGEPEHHLGEIFIKFLRSGAALEFIGIQQGYRIQLEMSLANVDGAGDDSIYRGQQRKCALLKLKSSRIKLEAEVVKAKSLAQPNVTQLPI